MIECYLQSKRHIHLSSMRFPAHRMKNMHSFFCFTTFTINSVAKNPLCTFPYNSAMEWLPGSVPAQTEDVAVVGVSV